jgi:hypothetical protein
VDDLIDKNRLAKRSIYLAAVDQNAALSGNVPFTYRAWHTHNEIVVIGPEEIDRWESETG